MKELWKQDRTSAVVFALALAVTLVQAVRYEASGDHLTIAVGGAYLFIGALIYLLARSTAAVNRLTAESRA